MDKRRLTWAKAERSRPIAGNEKQPGKTAEEKAVIRTTQNTSIGKMFCILLSPMACKTTGDAH